MEDKIRSIFKYLFTLPYSYDREGMVVKYIYYICAWILFIVFIVAFAWALVWIAQMIVALAFLAAHAQGKATDIIKGKNKE